jgi:putative transcriptional regulator
MASMAARSCNRHGRGGSDPARGGKNDRAHSNESGSGEELVSEGKLSSRGARIVKALGQLTDDIAEGTPIETKYTMRQVRIIPKPSLYPPARVRAVRELIGASQEVFAQWLAVSPMTIRSWEQGLRQPSPIARRFLDEIEMARDTSGDASSPPRLMQDRQTGRDKPASARKAVRAKIDESLGISWLRKRVRLLPRCRFNSSGVRAFCREPSRRSSR